MDELVWFNGKVGYVPSYEDVSVYIGAVFPSIR